MTQAETSGIHLEGTGAFVLDRVNGVAYVALSERANLQLAERWVDAMGYRVSYKSSCGPADMTVNGRLSVGFCSKRQWQ